MTNTVASTMPALTENQQIIWENVLRQQKHNALAIMVGEPRRVYTRLCHRLKGGEFLDFVPALTESIDINEEVSHFLSLCGPNGEEWIRGLMDDSGELSIMVTGVSSDILNVSVETFLGVVRRIRTDLTTALNRLLTHHGNNLGKKNFSVFAMMNERLETAGGVLQSLTDMISQIGSEDGFDDNSVHATIQETMKPIARNPSSSARTMNTDESSSSDESGSKSKPLVSIHVEFDVNVKKMTAPFRRAARATKNAATRTVRATKNAAAQTTKAVKYVTVNAVVNPTVATTRAVAHAASVTVDTVAVQPAKYTVKQVKACATATAIGAKKLWKKPGKTLARAFIPQSVRRKMVEALRDDGSSMMAPQQ